MIKRIVIFGKMDLAMRKTFNKTLYRYTLVISISLFCALIFLQIRESKLGSSYLGSENQILDNIYQGLTGSPLLSSILMAILGFFIVSNLIFSLFEKQIIPVFGFREIDTREELCTKSQSHINNGLASSQVEQNLPLNSSLSIFDAVIKCELSRLEDEVSRLKVNATSIAQTNQVIDSLMVRINTIIVDTQKNIDNFHVNVPAAQTLLKELDLLSIKADTLTKAIAASIDKLLIETDIRTDKVNDIISHVLLVPKEGQIPEINDYLTDFDLASKLTNELALDQAEIAQDVKLKLNELSDIAKETNLKSQCIVNSMRDISNTKQEHEIKATNLDDH